MLVAQLDHDRAQPLPGREQAQRACHRALADPALAGHDDQLSLQQRGHVSCNLQFRWMSAPADDEVEQLLVYDERGLVPCVVQDWDSGEVLTLAYMNELALERTRASWRAAPLESLAPGAVAQGRHERQHPGGSLAACRLRRRCAARARRARRPRLPHGRAQLLSIAASWSRRAPHETLPALERTLARARTSSVPRAPTPWSCSTIPSVSARR